MIQTLIGILVVIAIAIAWGVMPHYAAKREAQRFAQAEQEIRRQEDEARLQAEKRQHEEERQRIAEEALAAGLSLRKSADEEIAARLAQFKEVHDQLVDLIRGQAKKGCDAAFQQRFGVTRPPKAADAADDPEVQEFLREHYAALRDAAIAEYLELLIAQEVERRTTLAKGEEEDAAPNAADEALAAETDANASDAAETDAAEEERSAVDAASDEHDELDAQVREHFDLESVRTYLLAAIGSRFNAQGLPVGEIPWPGYTCLSPLGYGELALAEGAPVAAQDAYRAFAWKKFHLGRRAEKPTRGEYSWPASHELGDADAGHSAETPGGFFSVATAEGPLPLRELAHCRWNHAALPQTVPQGDLLLQPDGQRVLLVSLEGLRKGTQLHVGFGNAEAFLEDAGATDYAYCAQGSCFANELGISVSNPNAASPGDAPYRLAERTGTGFVLELTQDARRHDDETYPQFLQVNLAWRSEHAPCAKETVLHAIS